MVHLKRWATQCGRRHGSRIDYGRSDGRTKTFCSSWSEAGKGFVLKDRDSSCSFDSLDRGKLLQKLEHYGVRGSELAWFRSYLVGRKQCVKYKGAVSSELTTSYGIPQGGSVSGLLFVIYMNDIVYSTTLHNFFLYADDTTVFTSDVTPSTAV